MRRTSSRIAFVLSLTAVAWGCGDSTSSESIALSLSTNSLALAQGGSQQITVTIQRSNFDKPVTLSIQGQLPQGISAEFALASLPAGVSTTLLTVEVAGNAAPTTSASFIVRASGEGVTEQTQDVTVSVVITGTYTLGLLEPNLSVAQGGGGNATVLVTRNNGNAGDVALTVGALPAGVTATFAQSTTTSGVGALIIAVASDAATGTYPITITSSSPGHTPDQTTTLSLMIVPAPATVSVSMVFCSTNVPTWVAYRNQGFGWQSVTPTGGSVTFNASERVSVALAFVSSTTSDFWVYQLHQSELAYFNDSACSGDRSYTGQVSGLSTGQSALVSLGSVLDVPDASSPTYALDDLPSRPLDLFAARGVLAGGTFPTPDRIIVRRGLDLPNASVIPELNFTATESFPPVAGTLTVNNAFQSSLIAVQHTLITSTATYGILQYAEATSTPVSLYSVPADRMIAGDVHELFVEVSQSNRAIGQGLVEYSNTAGDRSVTLGPALAQPNIAMVRGSFSRPRATFPSQSEYSSVGFMRFLQSGLSSARRVTTVMTDAYLGGTPSQWDLVLPDFSGAAGFNEGWMLAPNISTQYLTQAFGGDKALIFGGAPQAGDGYRFAFHESSTTSLRQSRVDGVGIRRPPVAQYFKR